MNFGALEDSLAEEMAGLLATRWVQRLSSHFRDLKHVPIMTLLKHSAYVVEMHSLAAQVLLAISHKVETELARQCTETLARTTPPAMMTMTWADDGSMWDPSNQDRNVCQYVMCGIEQLGHQLVQPWLLDGQGLGPLHVHAGDRCCELRRLRVACHAAD